MYFLFVLSLMLYIGVISYFFVILDINVTNLKRNNISETPQPDKGTRLT